MDIVAGFLKSVGEVGKNNLKSLQSINVFGTVDKELAAVLKELSLEEYKSKFSNAMICYSDLRNLRDDELKGLVKDYFPRKRLKKYIDDKFSSYVDRKNAWEISPKEVTIDKDEKLNDVIIAKGAYGVIKVGKIKVGITDIPVVLKEILVDGKSTTKKGIIAEVTVHTLLRSRNCVKCFGCWFSKDNKVAYIVLEYCVNGDLNNFLKKNKDMSTLDKLQALHQIAIGMEYIHKQGLIHRDLKPANVLVANDGTTMKICDFGTTKNKKDLTGSICGTPIYLAPEQYRQIVTKKPHLMDVYAYGIIAWEILTGKIPFLKLQKKHRKSAFAFMKAVHKKGAEQRPDASLIKGVPKELVELICECWDKDIASRKQSFEEIVEEVGFAVEALKGSVDFEDE